MQIDIFNINKFIDTFDCREVTSANIMSSHSTIPDPDGLGSYEIFGMPGTTERKQRFGYISLNGDFLHPHVFMILTSVFRAIEDLIFGESQFYLLDGQIIRYTEGMELPKKVPVGTGITFLKEIWDDIQWKTSDSRARTMRLEVLRLLTKEEVFIDKWLVIPPYFRDIDMATGKKNDRNMEYTRLLNAASMLKSTTGLFELKGTTDAHRIIQRTINEMYSFFVGFVTGVKGFVHKHVMGKSTDYSSRVVLSMSKMSSSKVDDMEVSFTKSAAPLSIIAKIFIPFIKHGIRKFVTEYLKGSLFLYDISKPEGQRRMKLAEHWEEVISDDGIDQMVELYYNSKEHRTDIFTVEGADKEKHPLLYVVEDPTDGSAEIVGVPNLEEIKDRNFRLYPFTLTHLLYKVAMDTVGSKVIFVTRYPVEDYHNIYPSYFNLIPCNKFSERVVDGIKYPRWPDLSGITKENIGKSFIDTFRVFPTYLEALGADFDGDQISIQGLYTKEAQEEAENYMKSNSIAININGATMRTPKDTFLHTLYGLTAGPKF